MWIELKRQIEIGLQRLGSNDVRLVSGSESAAPASTRFGDTELVMLVMRISMVTNIDRVAPHKHRVELADHTPRRS